MFNFFNFIFNYIYCNLESIISIKFITHCYINHLLSLLQTSNLKRKIKADNIEQVTIINTY